MEKQISVIIPIYNEECFLMSCLDSLCKQTYQNIEIILVNDGSTDNSKKICENYKAKDDRIVVIDIENGGQANARNIGLEHAKGQYIAYVDADDVLHKDYFRYLISTAVEQDADLIQCDFVKFINKIKNFNSNKINSNVDIFTSEEAIELLCYQKKINNSPWCKLIKKEVAQQIKFPTGIGYEDLAVVYQWINISKIIAYISIKLYYYRQHKESTMKKEFSEKKIDRLKITEQMTSRLQDEYPKLILALQTRMFLSCIQTLMWLPLNKKYIREYQKIWKYIKNYRKTIFINKKVKISIRIIALTSYMGIFILRILGGVYRKFAI